MELPATLAFDYPSRAALEALAAGVLRPDTVGQQHEPERDPLPAADAMILGADPSAGDARGAISITCFTSRLSEAPMHMAGGAECTRTTPLSRWDVDASSGVSQRPGARFGRRV